MEELAIKFHETVNLGIFIENYVTVIDRVESLETLRIDHGIGKHLPAYCTALGKVFLANLQKGDLERYCRAQKFIFFTNRTIKSAKELKRNLVSVRKEGYAIDDRELDNGICCVSAPIRGESGRVVAAISISGPSTRITLEKLKSFNQSLTEITEKISEKLGYQGGRSTLRGNRT
jgi:DNA-binding IclR family transcriptional regulator